MLRFGQRGDTIVEVLIALGVIGLTIAVGYSIATRSLNGVQVAKERSEATKIAEGQIEQLRRFSQDPTADLTPAGSDQAYCYRQVDGQKRPVADVADATTYDIDCRPGRYRVSIQPTTGTVPCFGGGGNKDAITFNVDVAWDRSGGGEGQNLRLVYRVPTGSC